MAGHVLVYLTMKGGVGKTTLAANVTRALADIRPRRILLIDCDAQCNLSQVFLEDSYLERLDRNSVIDAFRANPRLKSPGDIKTTLYSAREPGSSVIDLVPGSFETFSFVVAPPSEQDAAAAVFRHFIKQARAEYDLVVLDTNPSATFVTLQALEVADFLVAPITFDSFAFRGIDLIVRTLRNRYGWLRNPKQMLIVPNKVERTSNPATIRQQSADEKAIEDRFPHLTDSITISRIHSSKLLDNRLAKRGHGFACDQRVLPLHWKALRRVLDDFAGVANALNVALDEAFDDSTNKPRNSYQSVQEAVSQRFGRPA